MLSNTFLKKFNWAGNGNKFFGVIFEHSICLIVYVVCVVCLRQYLSHHFFFLITTETETDYESWNALNNASNLIVLRNCVSISVHVF